MRRDQDYSATPPSPATPLPEGDRPRSVEVRIAPDSQKCTIHDPEQTVDDLNHSADESKLRFELRHADEADLPAIVDIYNQSIPGAWSTADTRPISVDDRREWFNKFDPNRRPIWVVHCGEQMVAWVCLTSFYGGRPAYDATAEISLYIASGYQRKGLGRYLKEWVIAQCPRLGVTTLLSMYFDHNEATRKLNENLGFEVVGHLTEIAIVEGKKRGLVIAARRIPALFED
jgi:phosphinothricin acetyltransferase